MTKNSGKQEPEAHSTISSDANRHNNCGSNSSPRQPDGNAISASNRSSHNNGTLLRELLKFFGKSEKKEKEKSAEIQVKKESPSSPKENGSEPGGKRSGQECLTHRPGDGSDASEPAPTRQTNSASDHDFAEQCSSYPGSGSAPSECKSETKQADEQIAPPPVPPKTPKAVALRTSITWNDTNHNASSESNQYPLVADGPGPKPVGSQENTENQAHSDGMLPWPTTEPQLEGKSVLNVTESFSQKKSYGSADAPSPSHNRSMASVDQASGDTENNEEDIPFSPILRTNTSSTSSGYNPNPLTYTQSASSTTTGPQADNKGDQVGSSQGSPPLDRTSFIPNPKPDTMTRHSNNDNVGSNKDIVCDICLLGSPELCCLTCDPEGVPYHTNCWITERLHKPRPNQSYQTHQSIPIDWLGRLRYLTEPNKQTSIEESQFQEDDLNCFIKFSIGSQRFRFGHRAFTLLRHRREQDGVQYPSFVSFVGRTMNGKSFLIRALQYREAADRLPTPIPAPGAKAHNHTSTSSDIHLYADSATACDESPILYLDCEGFEGSDVPRSLRARLTGSRAAERRALVDVAYPRLVYAFSTCIVFVTSGPLAGADDIKRRLISYASQGASGSRNQGFKPSLFVVFNHFRDGNTPNFDWSIDASSDAFLASGDRAELENFYSNIRVVYVPSMDTAEAAIALQQINALEEILREAHEEAFSRRKEFRLVFTTRQLTNILQRALQLFSKDFNSVFDWSIEAAHLESDYGDLAMPFRSLWMQYMKHHSTPTTTKIPYNLVREDFERHIMLCLCLELRRNPPSGLPYNDVPQNWAKQMDQLCFEYSPCGASSSSGLQCEKVRLRHGDYHQDLTNQAFPVTRWPGVYQPCEYATSQTFQESFGATLERYSTKGASLDDLKTLRVPDIRSIVTCLGCLQGPPSTVLACGHAFCLDCVRELTHDDPLPHHRKDIRCPIHQEPQNFSPRLLPIQSGYRILSLDGGGVKGLAQLIMLRDIEKRCFEIPLTHLFDLVVGTCIGGQIALALNAGTTSGPLTVAAAMEKFRELMKSVFDRKSLAFFRGGTRYKTSTLESHLQGFFGNDKLFSASQLGHPNIAVTAVMHESSEVHLVTNYNRKPSADVFPILLGPNPEDCMPLWAAARCTFAAVPYFKPLEWQGQMLLDGGFKLNCPAACAYSEAKCIWPDKHYDILLSLGTGRATNREAPPVHNRLFRATHAITDDITDTEGAWEDFLATLVQKDDIFRLNPTYPGTGFELDDFRKLDEIEEQTAKWIATQNAPLTKICDHLIAALFFFHPLGSIEDGMQAAEVLCRLPPSLLEARENLVGGILQEADPNLFVVEYDSSSGTTVHVYIDVAETLRNLRVAAELRLRVNLHDLPVTGGVMIHVKMRSLGTSQWLPISGSPYVI